MRIEPEALHYSKVNKNVLFEFVILSIAILIQRVSFHFFNSKREVPLPCGQESVRFGLRFRLAFDRANLDMRLKRKFKSTWQKLRLA